MAQAQTEKIRICRRVAAMSRDMCDWAFKVIVPHFEKMVLLVLANCHNKKTGKCNPSLPYLAKYCGGTERGVMNAIKRLRSMGLISTSNRVGVSTEYTLNVHVESNHSGHDTPEQGSPLNAIQGLNDVQETPEQGSPLPLNVIQVTPERHSGDPGTSFRETRKEPGIEPGNRTRKETKESARANEVVENLIQSDGQIEPSDPVRQVFDHWQEVHGHHGARLDDKRRKVIRDRLKEKYTVETLKLAIDGAKQSAFHQGQNESATVYDALTMILRNADQIDKFVKLACSADLSRFSSAGRQTIRSGISWVEEVKKREQH